VSFAATVDSASGDFHPPLRKRLFFAFRLVLCPKKRRRRLAFALVRPGIQSGIRLALPAKSLSSESSGSCTGPGGAACLADAGFFERKNRDASSYDRRSERAKFGVVPRLAASAFAERGRFPT
jgi:hypothetical protein